MTTRMSQMFLQTLREAPSEARTRGQQLLTRAGFIRSLGGTGYALLPLGVRAQRRLLGLAVDAMAGLRGQPVVVPSVQLTELVGDGSPGVRFRDRAQRALTLGVDHDRAVLAATAGVVQSYKQLPVLLYEDWQPYSRDEVPGGGLLHAPQGLVFDAYGLHASHEELAAGYESIWLALVHVTNACDPTAYIALTDSDGIGHKVICSADDGAEVIARCPACGYAAGQAAAKIHEPSSTEEQPLPRRDVETPECKTIADLARFLNIPESRTAKAVFLMAEMRGQGNRFIFAVVRGDTALNEDKLKELLHAESLGPASEDEIKEAGAEPGYGSPVGLDGVTVVVDRLAAESPNLVAGANRAGYHTLNVNHGRDYQATLVADISMPQNGSPCPNCGNPLTIEHGIALAETWLVPEKAGDAVYLDRSGTTRPILLAHYRLYVDRLLAAAAEKHHDDNGLVWPAAIAPYDVYLMPLGKAAAELIEAAECACQDLDASGISVLYDDRDERAGVKFNDADLIGAPVRVTIGDRGLKQGVAEVKLRSGEDVVMVPLAELASHVRRILNS